MKDRKKAAPPVPAPEEGGKPAAPREPDEVAKAKEREEKVRKKLEELRKSDPFMYPMF